jgi:hypothetical protein
MHTPIYIRAIFVLLAVLVGCNEAKKEEAARAIYQNAQKLEKQGLMVEALEEYDRLVEFKKTETFKIAKARLLDDGISIGKGVESLSIKKMFKVKNRLIKSGQERHPDGNVIVPISTKDAWGSELRVQYFTGPKFLFGVLSLGSDKKMNTDDDLRLYHEPGPQGLNAKRTGSTSKKKPRQLAESSVEINDLLKGKMK